MLLAKVTGAVVPAVRDARLTGLRLLAAEALAEPSAAPIVAADTLGAGVGDIVLIATGQAARLALPGQDAPVDAAVVAILEQA